MHLRILLCSACLAAATLTPCASAQSPAAEEQKPGVDYATYPCDDAVDVFVAGANNPYVSIRIPDVVKAGDKLVAIAEGRYKDTDQGENDLIASISEDGGKTWSKPTVAAASKGATFNNPCLIYDEQKDMLVLFFQRYPEGIKERTPNIPTGYKDKRCIRNFVCFSRNGKKWTKPRDVTKTTKHDDVTITCSGPNPGVQIKHGRHQGRLVVPLNEGPFGKWTLAAAYSDNHGKTWKIGNKSASGGGVNEVSIVETDDGGLLIVSRASSGNNRKLSYSNDGGETWGDISAHPELPSPGFGCQNGLARYSFADEQTRGGKSRILFSAPPGGNRADGIVKMSYDNGKTWPVSKSLCRGPFAYSVLTPVKPGVMGLLYEVEGRPVASIRFTTFTIDWLTNGADSGLAEGMTAEEVAEAETATAQPAEKAGDAPAPKTEKKKKIPGASGR